MPQKQHLAQLKDTSAIQHADDDYWYRPLVLGDNLFTYVAHVRPSGYMPIWFRKSSEPKNRV